MVKSMKTLWSTWETFAGKSSWSSGMHKGPIFVSCLMNPKNLLTISKQSYQEMNEN